MAGEAGHLHPERHLERLCLRQAVGYRRLHRAPFALDLPHAFQRGIQINADEALAGQAVTEMALPRRPQTVAGVGLKRAVVDFLRQRHAGFNDDISRAQHPGQARGAPGQGETVTNAQADHAAANKLRNGHQHRKPLLCRDANHRARVAAQAGHFLERGAVAMGQRQNLTREMFQPQSHRVAEVARCLDDSLAWRRLESREQWLVERQRFLNLAKRLVIHQCQFEFAPQRQQPRRDAHGGSRATLHLVQGTAHFVSDHRGTGRHAVHQARPH